MKVRKYYFKLEVSKSLTAFAKAVSSRAASQQFRREGIYHHSDEVIRISAKEFKAAQIKAPRSRPRFAL